ncbi:MAG: hypothetical protein GF417_01385 [Candidatus Latescibacteria bacterium]|nr:hypothetical protein [Candidatus Latescibacterota bacterium]
MELVPIFAGNPPELEQVPVLAPFRTGPLLLKLVKYLKYSGGRSAASGLSWWMAQKLICSCNTVNKKITLVPVPLHRSRRRRRGYNQAELVARGVSELTGLGVRTDLIARVRKTRSQAKLPPKGRKQNVAGAFRASGEAGGTGFILVDDIVTTGETAGECLGVLKDAGASPMAVLAAGTSLGD